MCALERLDIFLYYLKEKMGSRGQRDDGTSSRSKIETGGVPFLLFTIFSTYQTTNDFLTCLCFIRFFKSINIKIGGKETVLYLLTQKSVCNAKSGNSRLQSSVSCDRICVKYRGFFVCLFLMATSVRQLSELPHQSLGDSALSPLLLTTHTGIISNSFCLRAAFQSIPTSTLPSTVLGRPWPSLT